MGIKLEGIFAAVVIIIGLVIVGIILLIITYMILKALGKFNNINIFNKLNLKKSNNTLQTECFNVYCNEKKYGYNLLTQNTYFKKINKLEDSILKEQMNFAEQRLDYIKEDILLNYKQFFDKKLLIVLFYTVRDILRMYYKENNIENKFGEEWKDYKENKLDFIGARVWGEISFYYNDDVKLEQLKNNLETNYLEKLKDELFYILDEARKITIKKDLEIKQVYDEIEDFKNKTCGRKQNDNKII
jgi:hypothetical protein